MNQPKRFAKQALNFFAEFTDLESLVNTSYIQRPNDQRTRAFRQVKLSEVSFGKVLEANFLDINLSFQSMSYINRHISPIVKVNDKSDKKDVNRLMLGLVFIKVFFPEKDSFIYLPLVMVDITDKKEQMLNNRDSEQTVRISLEDNVVLNDGVLSYFFDFKTEESKKLQEEFIAEKISDLIVDTSIGTKLAISRLYQMFKSKLLPGLDLEILFPEAVSDKSGVFMFFNMKEQFKTKNLFLDLAEKPNQIITDYLAYEQPENKSAVMSNDYWLGSMTKSFPLGHGQGVVMSSNQQSHSVIPVIGGPGTGKTTLFLSLVANEITKRALSIIENDKDYNNLMLITSTSNKAVENVYGSLSAFGFCYVGGNSENKANSVKDVKAMIEKLSNQTFDEATYKKTAKSIKKIVKSFKSKQKDFEELKSLKNVTSMDDLIVRIEDMEDDLSNMSSEEEFKIVSNTEALIGKLSKISGGLFAEDKLSIWLDEIEVMLSKRNELGFISKFIKEKGLILELESTLGFSGLNLDKVNKLKSLLSSLDLLGASYNLALANIALRSELQELIDIREQYKGKENKFKKFLNAKTFGEFFRTNLYSLNYKLFLAANSFMHQHSLKHKTEVLKALGYLERADFKDRMEYLRKEYSGIMSSEARMNSFMRHISMVYPVTTSTLAAVNGMWAGFFNSKTIYRTVLADEAGMITSKDMVPALTQATRAIIVGDPKQLRPIVSLNDMFLDYFQAKWAPEFWNKYSPSVVSAFHRSAGTLEGGFKVTGSGIMLDEHRRCVKSIADMFIDIADYKGLKVRTIEPKYPAYEALKGNRFFFNVKNPNGTKVNNFEVDAIDKVLTRLESIGFDLKTQVGIITPYVAQETALINRFSERVNHSHEKSKIGTVHKFQGVEFDVVIFSSVISRDDDSLSFINQDPSMINVSISRAKHAFMVVGDYDRLTSEDGYAKQLANHLKDGGKYADLSIKNG